MKLLTKDEAEALPKLYGTEEVEPEDKIAHMKFFAPEGRATFYVCEFDGEDTFFGYVVSPLGEDCDEFGYFSLRELEEIRTPRLKLPIERDLYFTPTKLGQIIPKLSAESFLQ